MPLLRSHSKAIVLLLSLGVFASCGLLKGPSDGSDSKEETEELPQDPASAEKVTIKGLVAADGLALTTRADAKKATMEVVRTSGGSVVHEAVAKELEVVDGSFSVEIPSGFPHIGVSGDYRAVVPPAKGQDGGVSLAFVINKESTSTAKVFEQLESQPDAVPMLEARHIDYVGLFEMGAALSSANERSAVSESLVAKLATTFLAKNVAKVEELKAKGIEPKAIRDSIIEATAAALVPAEVEAAFKDGTYSQGLVARKAKKAVEAKDPSLVFDTSTAVAKQVASDSEGIAFAQAHVVQEKLLDVLEKVEGNGSAKEAIENAIWNKVSTLDASALTEAIEKPDDESSELNKLTSDLIATGGDEAKILETLVASGACVDPAPMFEAKDKTTCEQTGGKWESGTKTSEEQNCSENEIDGEKVCETVTEEIPYAYCDTRSLYATESQCQTFCYASWGVPEHSSGSGNDGSGDDMGGSSDGEGSDGVASGDGEGDDDGGSVEGGDGGSGGGSASLTLQEAVDGEEESTDLSETCNFLNHGTYADESEGETVQEEDAPPETTGEDDGESNAGFSSEFCSKVNFEEGIQSMNCAKDDPSKSCAEQYSSMDIGGSWSDSDDDRCTWKK